MELHTSLSRRSGLPQLGEARRSLGQAPYGARCCITPRHGGTIFRRESREALAATSSSFGSALGLGRSFGSPAARQRHETRLDSVRVSSHRCRRFVLSSEGGPWWQSLESVYLLVFNSGQEDEGIYTISSRDGDNAENKFLAFVDPITAEKVGKAVERQLLRTPDVVAVAPAVLSLLGREAEYGIEIVPRGVMWEPPKVMVDLTKYDMMAMEGADGSLAVSREALMAFLNDRADASPEDTPAESGDGASAGPVSEEARVQAAQRAAAAAVRAALLEPLAKLRGAVGMAALVEPVSRLREAFARAAGIRTSAGGGAAGADAEPQMPAAPTAVYRALIELARKRLMDQQQQ